MTALPLLIGYLLGSIPFGLILTRVTGAGDLRAIGSGNIGATNVLRTGRKGLAAATLLLDMAKGAAAVMIGQKFGSSGAVIGGAAAFVGHVYPIWLKFRGGKGVATMLGVTLALNWMLGLVFALVWLAALAVTRTSSVGGMSAAIAVPIAAAMIVIWKHRANIGRLIDGTEPKVGQTQG